MRIAVMYRAADETGGIGVYSRNIISNLLNIDQRNSYILLYKTEKHFGMFEKHQNVKELILNYNNKALWDQIFVPWIAHKERCDIIFNTKFTVPLVTNAKTMMVTHGADYYIPPYQKVYNKMDVLYIKLFMPLYFRKCSFVSSVSDYCTENFQRALPRYRDKIKTIYLAPNQMFKKNYDQEHLDNIKKKYSLPDKFILSIIRYDEGTKNTRKNFASMIRAFANCKQRHSIPHKYVVVGNNCYRYGIEHNLRAMGVHDDVLFPGLVPQEDLPAFYNLADLYLYPTIIEAFPIPLTEAMRCGCPIVTSNTTGCDELGADVALKVDPLDVDQISDAIMQVINNDQLRFEMIAKGLERSNIFSWQKCAEETLQAFEQIYFERKN